MSERAESHLKNRGLSRRKTSGKRPKAWLAWSSGKDSAWALHKIQCEARIEVTALLTTITEIYKRVAMHGVREHLVKAQAEAAGLPLEMVRIPSPCPNEVYEEAMAEALVAAIRAGVTHVIFGDLFLEDIRRYRERQMAALDLTPVFPLWGRDTTRLAREMLEGGLEAYLTCVDPKQIDASFAGRRFDAQLIRDLPSAAGPCGENGEFHTFACAGPMFRNPIPVVPGEIVPRDGFVFADFLPANRQASRGAA
ncbi:MAG: ATP-binding protein [Candidatus Acidiferrales bacterium]